MRFLCRTILVGWATVAMAVGAESFQVRVRQLRSLEDGIFTVAYIEAHGETFRVVVPHGWRISLDSEQRGLSLAPGLVGTPYRIRFSPVDGKSPPASAEALRQATVPFLNEAALLEDFTAQSGYGPGRGLDLAYALRGQNMKSRVVVIPLRQGYASFIVMCPAEEAPAVWRNLGAIITSFAPSAATPPEQVWFDPTLRSAGAGRVKAVQSESVQAVPALHTEPPPSVVERVVDMSTIFDGWEMHLGFGLIGLVMAVLLTRMVARHRREAELRALTGGYLSDGTELASFPIPDFFAPAPMWTDHDSSHPDFRSDWVAADKLAESPTDAVGTFLGQAPELIAKIRTALQELGRRNNNEAEWGQTLARLPQLFIDLKEKANFWEMRPVWQLASALELLAQRVAQKPKDATPSIFRTIRAATDLLPVLCVRGIRPNLTFDPPMRILTVDDDALCLRAMVFALQKMSLPPDVAENGDKALALAAKNSYDVIFMDIQMPVMDGLTACAKIRETELNADTPVVFVTSQSDFHSRAQSTVMGGSDLMAKPFLVFEMTVKALTFTMRRRLAVIQAGSAVRPDAAVEALAAPTNWDRSAMAARLAQARIAPLPSVEQTREAAAEAAAEESPNARADFLAEAPEHLDAMWKIIEEIDRASCEPERQEWLGELYLRVHSFGVQSGTAGLALAAQLGSALEGLLKKLYEKPKISTPSTLNTIAHAMDLLEQLHGPGIQEKLAALAPARILVVDDEPLARRAIAGALQLVFQKPELAEDGTSGLRLVTEKPYDVIFTDVQMPGLDGFELCEQIRTSAFNRSTPVIFVTSQGDDEARDKALQSGGSDFIAKPCLPSEITLKALTFHLRKRLDLVNADPATTPVFATEPAPSPIAKPREEELATASA